MKKVDFFKITELTLLALPQLWKIHFLGFPFLFFDVPAFSFVFWNCLVVYLDLEVCVTLVTAESVTNSPQFPEHFPPTSHFDFGFQEELGEAVFCFPGNKVRGNEKRNLHRSLLCCIYLHWKIQLEYQRTWIW